MKSTIFIMTGIVMLLTAFGLGLFFDFEDAVIKEADSSSVVNFEIGAGEGESIYKTFEAATEKRPSLEAFERAKQSAEGLDAYLAYREAARKQNEQKLDLESECRDTLLRQDPEEDANKRKCDF